MISDRWHLFAPGKSQFDQLFLDKYVLLVTGVDKFNSNYRSRLLKDKQKSI